MQFYQVKAECDGMRFMRGKQSRIDAVIGGELITKREQKKSNIPLAYLRKVTVKKTDTYWFFGARLASSDNILIGWI